MALQSPRGSSGLDLAASTSRGRRRRWGPWKVVAVVLLLLFLAAAVAALFSFKRFRAEVQASNRRVPVATKRALAPAGDVLSEPQVVLTVFDRASLFARVDPERRVISLLSIPGSAYLQRPGGVTVGKELDAGAAGFVRFARAGLHLRVEHVALLRARDIGPLVAAIGGVAIEDDTGTHVLDGVAAQRYISAAAPSSLRRQRERAVLEGVISRLASVASLSRLPDLARTFSGTVATDLSPRDTLALALVRLRSKLSIQCGVPEQAALSGTATLRVLRQFEGATRSQRNRARIFPTSGCRATLLSVRAPAAVLFFGKQALALFPFVPELVAAAIALDLILLSAFLGVPQALLRLVRKAGPAASLPGGIGGEAELDASLLLRLPRDACADQTTGYAGPHERSSPRTSAGQPGVETEVERPLEEGSTAVKVDEPEYAADTKSRVSAPSPTATWRVPRLTGMRATVMFRLMATGLREHPDVGWFVAAAAAAIVLGYLIATF